MIERQYKPIQIVTKEDLHSVGIDITASIMALLAANSNTKTLWWQRKGGVLYSITINSDKAESAISYEIHLNSVGDYEQLSKSALR